jgi:hypothetical protein
MNFQFALLGSHCYAFKPFPHNLYMPGIKYPALRGLLTFGFDGNSVVAKDVQFSLSKILPVKLATLVGRVDRLENSRVGDASLGVIRNQLVSVGCYADTGITGLFAHEALLIRDHADSTFEELQALSKGLELRFRILLRSKLSLQRELRKQSILSATNFDAIEKIKVSWHIAARMLNVHWMMGMNIQLIGSCWFTTGEGQEMAEMARVGTLDLSMLQHRRVPLRDVNDALSSLQDANRGFNNFVVIP